MQKDATKWVILLAQIGYYAKGFVYILLGLLGFLTAFELRGHQNGEATTSGTLQFLKALPGGKILLLALFGGLVCYGIWRALQTLGLDGYKNKKWPKRLRYALSGLAYLALAFTAMKLVLGMQSNGSSRQDVVALFLQEWFGQILVGLGGLAFAAIGFYQMYYGYSGKYKKRVQGLSLKTEKSKMLLKFGKVGFLSRGFVWVMIGALFIRAAINASASQAGDTAKAFSFLESTPFGSYLLAILSLGLLCYGIFNFVRARYEKFTTISN